MKYIILTIFLAFTMISARDIKIAVGYSLPPYVIEKENRGIELDIVRESLRLQGINVIPLYVPAARIRYSIENGSSEAAMTVNEDSGIHAFYSNPHIFYQNVVVSIKSRNLKLTSVESLADYSVVAWQDAKLYLGEPYKKSVERCKNYAEMADQLGQVAMIMAGRTDLLVIDRHIFQYFAQSKQLPVAAVPTTIHELFPVSEYKVCFRDKDVRDAFNRGLAQLKKSGRYDEIIEFYVGKVSKN